MPELARISAGSFAMGAEAGATWERPVHQVHVSEFWITTRPITYQQYRAFRPSHEAENDVRGDAPVTGIDWNDASAYCRWLGERTGKKFRLPTEAEWEKAVRGGLEGKKYPWGDEPPVPEESAGDADYKIPERANGFGVTAGVYNLWEWVADPYASDYYKVSPGADPQGPETSRYRVLRGGGYRDDPNSMRCSNRGSARPATLSNVITFRVVSTDTPPSPQVTEAPRPDRAQPPVPAAPAPSPTPSPVPSPVPSTATAPPIPEPSAPKPPAPVPSPPIPSPAPSPAPSPGPSTPARVADKVTRLEIAAEGSDLIVTLHANGRPNYKTLRLSNPDRLVIDIIGARMLAPRANRPIAVGRLGVRRVRLAQFRSRPPVARTVIDLEAPRGFHVEVLDDGLRIHVKTLP